MVDYYSQDLLDEAATPAHWKEWAALPEEQCHNASCGDTIAIRTTFVDQKLDSVEWHSAGCSLSKAAASVMSQLVVGKTDQEILHIDRQEVQGALDLEYLSPGRIKCVLLFTTCLQKQIQTSWKGAA